MSYLIYISEAQRELLVKSILASMLADSAGIEAEVVWLNAYLTGLPRQDFGASVHTITISEVQRWILKSAVATNPSGDPGLAPLLALLDDLPNAEATRPGARHAFTPEPLPAGIFGAAGPMAAPKMWVGTVVTNASGVFTANYASAGFQNPPFVQTMAIGAGTAAMNSRQAALSAAPTTTSCAGTVVQPVNVVLASPSAALSGAGVVVHILAIGN